MPLCVNWVDVIEGYVNAGGMLLMSGEMGSSLSELLKTAVIAACSALITIYAAQEVGQVKLDTAITRLESLEKRLSDHEVVLYRLNAVESNIQKLLHEGSEEHKQLDRRMMELEKR